MKKLVVILYILFFSASCVSKKEYDTLQKKNSSLSKKNKELQRSMEAVLLEQEKYEAIIAYYQYRIDSFQRVVDLLQPRTNSQMPAPKTKNVSKVAFGEWNEPKYETANTALGCSYMSEEEKEFIKLWNYCRLNPQLFLNTYLKKIKEKAPQFRTSYESSLIVDLQNQIPLPVIKPDKVLFTAAKCHAYNSGVIGHVGHNRKSYSSPCPIIFRAECCSYGNLDALGHLINLLVDEGVSSLGHRKALLAKYEYAGVSIQPHKTFSFNMVIDMHYNMQEK